MVGFLLKLIVESYMPVLKTNIELGRWSFCTLLRGQLGRTSMLVGGVQLPRATTSARSNAAKYRIFIYQPSATEIFGNDKLSAIN